MDNTIKELLDSLDISEIQPNIYLGSGLFSTNFDKFRLLHINTIIDLTEERYYTAPEGFQHYRFPIDDGEVIPFDVMEKIFTIFFQEIQKGPLLIHCGAGMSRSAGVLVACLMKQNHEWTLEYTVQYVNVRRKKAMPHVEIMKGIVQYFEKVQGITRGNCVNYTKIYEDWIIGDWN